MLMGAGIKQGSKIEIKVDGPNESEHLQAIIDAIDGGFGEEMVPLEDIIKE